MTDSTLGFSARFNRSNAGLMDAAAIAPQLQGLALPGVNGQAHTHTSASSTAPSLLAAWEQAYQALLAFAERDDFEANLELAFGRSYDAGAIGQVWDQLKLQGPDRFANINVVTGDKLNGANGVYVQASDEIYLSDTLLSPEKSKQLTQVLLEEFGHKIDAQINSVDAPGDEGAIFAQLVQGDSLLPSALATLKAEDDHLQLELGGGWVEAEANAAAQLIWRHYGVGQNLEWNVDQNQVATGRSLDSLPDVNWRIQGTGDFNGDGKLDRVLRHHGVGQNLIQYTDGNNQVIGAKSLPDIPDIRWHIEGVGDFDQDGDSDIVLRHYGTGTNLVWYMNGSEVERAEALPAIPDLNWNIEAVGDFNRDANPDLVLRHRQTGQNLLWTMIGSTVQRSDLLPTIEDANWRIEGAGDFNQDGRADVMLRHYGVGANLVWTMEGATVTGALSLPSIPDVNWQPTVVGELPQKPQIKFTSFNQNNTIVAGLLYGITWEDQLSENVRIDLYKDGEFQRIAVFDEPSDGSYTWDSPSTRFMPEGDDYQLRIYSREDGSKQLFSPYFRVVKPSIQLNTPLGGESLRAGENIQITWSSNVGKDDKFSTFGGPEKVEIELYKSGESISKFSGLFGTDNDGSLLGQLPHLPEPGSDYQIEVSLRTPGTDAISLSQPFSILPKADIDIQLFNYNNTFNATQWRALNIAAENWEKLITNDKEPDGNLRVVTFGSGTLGSRTLAAAFQDTTKNGRKNYSNDDIRGTVDIGGVDYDNSVVWNLDLLPEFDSGDLIKIMMHELAHALGISHEFGDPDSLMSPTYAYESDEALVITEKAFAGLENLGYRVDRNAVSQLTWA